MSKASLLQRFAAASRAAAKRSFAASAPEAGEEKLRIDASSKRSICLTM